MDIHEPYNTILSVSSSYAHNAPMYVNLDGNLTVTRSMGYVGRVACSYFGMACPSEEHIYYQGRCVKFGIGGVSSKEMAVEKCQQESRFPSVSIMQPWTGAQEVGKRKKHP